MRDGLSLCLYVILFLQQIVLGDWTGKYGNEEDGALDSQYMERSIRNEEDKAQLITE
jgi:hypothetical protein